MSICTGLISCPSSSWPVSSHNITITVIIVPVTIIPSLDCILELLKTIVFMIPHDVKEAVHILLLLCVALISDRLVIFLDRLEHVLNQLLHLAHREPCVSPGPFAVPGILKAKRDGPAGVTCDIVVNLPVYICRARPLTYQAVCASRVMGSARRSSASKIPKR